MALFDIPSRGGRTRDSQLVNKINRKQAPKRTQATGGSSLMDRIQLAIKVTNEKLGHLKDSHKLCSDLEEIKDYIRLANAGTGYLAIDTETTGLDPMDDTLVGVGIYTPDASLGLYIPIAHKDFMTNKILPNQLGIDDLTEVLEFINELDIYTIWFNAVFDIRFLHSATGVWLNTHWDVSVAAHMLDENDRVKDLKGWHSKYVMNGESDPISFNDLFNGIKFDIVPLEVAYLYGANDSKLTYEAFAFQHPYLDETHPLCVEKGLVGVSHVYKDIEIPLIPVIAELEQTGINFDTELAKELSIKYHKELKRSESKCYQVLDDHAEELAAYRRKQGYNNKLADPVNLSSPQQIAIVLYDIFRLKSNDKEKPRGTGEKILTSMNHPFTKALLTYRGTDKLLTTYIDKLPHTVSKKTGRIHARFKSTGTVTGRFSSSEPNLQNIPARNLDVRQLFIPTEGYAMISSDYKSQEPRIAAHMSGDPKMINAFIQGRDLYSEMASLAFHVPYEDCLETKPDGTEHPEGKIRRHQAKQIFLGTLYGKGVAAIAKDLDVSRDEGQEIYDSVLDAFPDLKAFIDGNWKSAQEDGYVTTMLGRKRRLPAVFYPKFEFRTKNGKGRWDEVHGQTGDGLRMNEGVLRRYQAQMSRMYGDERREFIQYLKDHEGIIAIDNTGKISEAQRQSTNSRVQGSAGDQTKQAMIYAYNDKRLRALNFRLLIPVHDELIGECPIEHINEVKVYLDECMVRAAEGMKVPFATDIEVTDRWYGKSLEN